MREVLAQIATFAAFLAASGLGGWVVLRLQGEECSCKEDFDRWESELQDEEKK